MPRGPLGGERPGANSTLKLVIKETPVPEDPPLSVFPQSLISGGATKSDIKEDIAMRTGFVSQRVTVSTSISQLRGLGQTTTFTIDLDVSGMSPSKVSNMVDKLVNDGYNFDTAEFE